MKRPSLVPGHGHINHAPSLLLNTFKPALRLSEHPLNAYYPPRSSSPAILCALQTVVEVYCLDGKTVPLKGEAVGTGCSGSGNPGLIGIHLRSFLAFSFPLLSQSSHLFTSCSAAWGLFCLILATSHVSGLCPLESEGVV